MHAAMIPDNSPPLQTRPRMTQPANFQPGLDVLSASREVLRIPDGELLHFPGVFQGSHAQRWLAHCIQHIPWRQDHIRIAGRTLAVPRLQCWFGDADAHYSYSGIALTPLPWTTELLEIRAVVQTLCQWQFNCVLANLYRDGKDSVSWHSDDEPELGEDPVIASVSFGESRRFELRHRYRRSQSALRMTLHHGSLLVMRGATQQFWLHQVPKEKGVLAPRVNLTFRRILTGGERG